MDELKRLRGRGLRAAPRERDPDDGVGFFRGTARPDTVLMVACIDEFKDRFGVGPTCRVPPKSLDCGFITPRGYRMFRNRPVSRMRARHETLARDILETHADAPFPTMARSTSALVRAARAKEHGMLPSAGTVGDPHDNTMAESADGAYKTELA